MESIDFDSRPTDRWKMHCLISCSIGKILNHPHNEKETRLPGNPTQHYALQKRGE
jgi:hypothetical protein